MRAQGREFKKEGKIIGFLGKICTCSAFIWHAVKQIKSYFNMANVIKWKLLFSSFADFPLCHSSACFLMRVSFCYIMNGICSIILIISIETSWIWMFRFGIKTVGTHGNTWESPKQSPQRTTIILPLFTTLPFPLVILSLNNFDIISRANNNMARISSYMKVYLSLEIALFLTHKVHPSLLHFFEWLFTSIFNWLSSLRNIIY